MEKTNGGLPIALIFGGIGGERRVSEAGAYNLIEAAQNCGIPLLPIGITSHADWYIYLGEHRKIADGSWTRDKDSLVSAYPHRERGECGFITDLGLVSVAFAIPLLHGEYGEDGIVQGALSCAGIAYAGCDTLTGAVAFDKIYTKLVAESVGIPCVPWVALINDLHRTAHDDIGRIAYTPESAGALAEKALGYPLFVKPSRAGSSIGSSLVSSESELMSALRCASDVDKRVLIERAVTDKREIECAYFDSAKGELYTSPWQIKLKGGFYDYDTKYKTSSAVLARAELDENTAGLIKEYSKRLRSILSVRDISRFDYFLDAENNIYFNEINTFPGFTKTSLYLRMLSDSGIDIAAFLARLSSLCGGRGGC